MGSLDDPLEIDEFANSLKPLEWDDEVYEDEDDFVDPYAQEEYEEEYEEPGLGGFDDLKPFGSFDDGLGWDDPLF